MSADPSLEIQGTARGASTAASRPLILLVADGGEFGGAEVSMTLLTGALVDRFRFDAAISADAPEETASRLAATGVNVARIEGLRRRPNSRAMLRLYRLIKQRRPAAIVVNMTDQGDALGALLASRAARRPLIAMVRNVIPDRDPRKERLAGFALRVADCVLGASDFTAAYARSLGVRRVSVVKNGSLTPDLAEDARAQLQLDPDAFVVGGLGRLHDQKGWDVLCAAAALVHRRRRHFVFVVVGGGPGREALLARPDAAHVHFVGYRPRADSLLGAFDLLVVPSRYEAFGRVAAEGMLAGVPVIASSVGGLPEVIGEDGVLVPPEDPAALATAIVELGGNERMRATLVERARRRAQELFTVDRMASETASVIEGVLERAGAKVEG